MKKKIAITALTLAILFMSGCSHSTVRLKLNEDGSGEYKVTFGLNKEELESTVNDIGDFDAEYALRGYTKSLLDCDIEHGYYVHNKAVYNSITAKFEFKDDTELQEKLNNMYGAKRNSKIPRSNFIDNISSEKHLFDYVVKVDLKKSDILAEGGDYAIPLDSFDYDFELEIPNNAKVLSHNADTTKNNVYIWENSPENVKLEYQVQMKIKDVDARVIVLGIPALISLMVGGLMGRYYYKRGDFSRE